MIVLDNPEMRRFAQNITDRNQGPTMHILDHAIDTLEKKLVAADQRNKDRPNAKHQEAVDSFTEAIEVLKKERGS